MIRPFLKDLILAALRDCWSGETSSGWRQDNPACGQCNVTAMLLNELYGAMVLKTPLPAGEHFYNRVGSQRIDLTESQFPSPITYMDIPASYQEALEGTTIEKYQVLKSAFLMRIG